MFRKDYILRIVEEIARFLAKAMGLLKEGKHELAREWIQKGYKLLKADRGRLLNLPPGEMVEELERRQGLDFTKMELIADLIQAEGEILLARNDPGADNTFLKSLALYEYIDKNHNVYSFDRADKINRLKNKLNAQ